MLFSGSFKCVPDVNGRICLPKIFRHELTDQSHTIYLKPQPKFWIAYPCETLSEKLHAVAGETPDDSIIRDIRRRLMISVIPVHIDPQGRITLPDSLKQLVKNSVTLIGTGLDFEIWTEDAWIHDSLKGEGHE